MIPPIKLSSPATGEFWEIPILYEDDHLLVLDKPAGLLAAPDRYDTSHEEVKPLDLTQLLHAGIAAGRSWAVARGWAYLASVHWLDRDTSGAMLLAKTKPALVALADQFGADKPIQHQLALVQGSPVAERFEVNAKLGAHPLQPGKWQVDPRNGKKSATRFEVLERFHGYALIRCLPLTGRPHQIRVHLQNSGLRVVGDELYGGRALLLSQLKKDYRLKPGRVERPLLASPAVHSEQLELAHPVGGGALVVNAPWPKDLRVAVKYLRLYAAERS